MMDILRSFCIFLCISICLAGGGGGVSGGSSDASIEATSHPFAWKEIVQYGGDRFATLGANFSVTCVLSIMHPIKWTHNGRPLRPHLGYHIWTGRQSLASEGVGSVMAGGEHGFHVGGLTVYGVTGEHEGVYQCTPFSANRHSLYVLLPNATFQNGDDSVRILKVPKPVTLACNVTSASGEEVPVDWYKDGTKLVAGDRIKMSGSDLTIDPTEQSDVGSYKCQSKDSALVALTFDLVILSYKPLPKSTTALEGDQFSLTCNAEGVPTPAIEWTKDSVPIVEAINGTERLEFRTSEKGVVNATIVLTDVQQSDRGQYSCLISNHPSLLYNTTTTVRVKDIYAALWPFLGIVAEVVVLCIVIFIYEKKRTKSELDESDAADTAINRK